MTDIGELLERVKAARGGDRELDVDIAWAIEPERYGGAYWNGRTGKPGSTLPLKLDGMGRLSVRINCPSFTASIDAALALVERVLRPEHPGMTIELRFVWNSHDDRGWCRAEITWPSHEFIGHASSGPLAMIEALLQALTKERTNVQ